MSPKGANFGHAILVLAGYPGDFLPAVRLAILSAAADSLQPESRRGEIEIGYQRTYTRRSVISSSQCVPLSCPECVGFPSGESSTTMLKYSVNVLPLRKGKNVIEASLDRGGTSSTKSVTISGLRLQIAFLEEDGDLMMPSSSDQGSNVPTKGP